MRNNILYVLLMLGSVCISSVSQIILKDSANHKHEKLIQEYLNFKVIFSYTLFIFSTILTMVSYRVVPLSLGPVVEATGYFWVAFFGLLILKEKINFQKCIGLGIILCGIVIFNL